MEKTKDMSYFEVSSFKAKDEVLTELCASESTLGAVGEKNEAGFGKYDEPDM